MDPQLIDLAWEVQRETGSTQPIWVVCGYRSPETNAMLRRRRSGVARFSQHMLGHAMDFYVPGVRLEELRVIGLRLQRGGVGFYPSSGSPFVHMDTGGVRMWPRMTRNELLRVFPDGRTAYLPSDGGPLPGYQLALADIRKHGKDLPAAIEMARDERQGVKPLAKLLAKTEEDPDEDSDEAVAAETPAVPAASRALAPPPAALGRAAEHREKPRPRKKAPQKWPLRQTSRRCTTPRPWKRSPPARHRNALPPRRRTRSSSRAVIGKACPTARPRRNLPIRRSPVRPAAKRPQAPSPTLLARSRRSSARRRIEFPPDLALAYAAQPDREAPILSPPPATSAASQPIKAELNR